MKNRAFFVLILSLVMGVFSIAVHAQSADSLFNKYDSLAKTKQSRLDSTNTRINSRIDSVQGKINGVLNPDLNALGRTTREKISEKVNRKRTKADTLQAGRELDSTRLAVNHQIDSLRKLNLPTDALSRKLDSLNGLSPEQYLQQLDTKRQALNEKLNAPVRNVEGKINEKLAVMNKEGGGGANLPGQANLPGADLKNVAVPGTENLKLPETDINPENPLGKIENPLDEQLGSVADVKDKVSEVSNLPQEQIGKIKSTAELQGAQEKLGEANALTDKAQAYSGDAKNLAQGNLEDVKELPKGIEDRASKLSEVQELQKQTGEMGKYQEMIGKGNDPEALKALAKEQGKQQAMAFAKNHFAGKEQVLQQAMDNMSKLKTKYASLDSLTNIPKYRPNAMRGKPFIERLTPGMTFQIQKSATVWLDYNVLIGYRINGRLTIGAGWNERVGIGKKMSMTVSDRVYGPRVYGDVMIWKGFAARAELEKMRTRVESELVNYADASGRAWMWSVFVGLRKQYDFSKRLKGNFQFLYNLYDDHDSSPYLDRFNVRFGFEFPLKKKRLQETKEH